MTARLAAIWRHPIKGHGREALAEAALSPGRALPWDRVWAVLHEAARDDPAAGWIACGNFCRGARVPALMAITAAFDASSRRIRLCHPDRPDLSFDPDRDPERFLDWVRPLFPSGRAAPAALIRTAGQALTDTPYPSISLANAATLAHLEARVGRRLGADRFRANLWIDGMAPRAETGWVGQRLRIGEAELEIREPIERCAAISADPVTGQRDGDLLAELETAYDVAEFGVYATVTRAGRIAPGDAVAPVP